jgi:hypothetical protein
MGKSHQLPYPKSNSVSSKPFELVFSDVWGPAPTSVGRHSYYVSFIDDFSKFTWIYLLRFKSEVFQCFRDFQNMVERQFNHKILAVQSDWGENIKPSIPSSNVLALLTMCHVLMPINKMDLLNVNIDTSLRLVSLFSHTHLCH